MVENKNGIIKINKDDELLKYIRMVQSIIVFDNYISKPYLNTNENQEYMRNILSDVKNAFVVLGGADSVFQLLMNDIVNITAVDTNELQNFVFSLKRASIKTLNRNDYESFLVSYDTKNYLSSEIFNYVKDGFSKDENLELRFWEYIFSHVDRGELILYMFKGGLEAASIDIARNSLLYIKKNRYYYKLRENIEKSKINLITNDAIEALETDDKKYDFIYLSNILLYMNQKLEKEEFKEYIKKIKKVYDKNLNASGYFILDYLFGTTMAELTKDDRNKQIEIYNSTIHELNKQFDLKELNINAIPGATSLKGKQDTVIYSLKK